MFFIVLFTIFGFGLYLEKIMSGHGHGGSHTSDGANNVGAGTQMRDLTEEPKNRKKYIFEQKKLKNNQIGQNLEKIQKTFIF